MPNISTNFEAPKQVTISDPSNPFALSTTTKGTLSNVRQEKLEETSEHIEEERPRSPLHVATSADKLQEGLRQIAYNHCADMI